VKIASIAEVKAHLSAYVNASEAELVVITRNGKPAAVLLPIEDDAELERLALAYSTRFQAMLTEGRHQITTTGGISRADFWHEMGGEGVGAETPHTATRRPTLRPNKGTLAPRRARSEEGEKLQKIRRRDVDKAFHIDTDWGIDHLNQIERVVTRLQMMWMSSSPRRGSESQRREVLK
jgi:prevent-host-death family protein